MGLFTKEKHTHFERDAAGKVIRMTRNGEEVDPKDVGMKTGAQLEREYYAAHPEEKHKTLKKIGSFAKVVDRGIVKYNRRRPVQRYQPRRSSSSYNNFNPMGSMFDMGMRKPKVSHPKAGSKIHYANIGGKAYPIAKSHRKKKGKKKKKAGGLSMGGFDMMDNWGFMK